MQEKHCTCFIDAGTCHLHIVNNSFAKGINSQKSVIDVDRFAIDLHFFFSLSSARRGDFQGMSEITDVTVHYLLKQCCTRWLSIDKVVVRIIEEYANIKEYFLAFLPKQNELKGSTGIGSTDRYKRIKSVLEDETTIVYMSFVVYISQDF